MASGRVIAPYNSDIYGVLFEVDVPLDDFADTGRGWAINTLAAGKTPRLPKRLTPRHVIGVDSTGHRRRAVVADLTADLWTGTATTFASDEVGGTTRTCTVTGYVGEKATTTPNP